MSGHFKFGLVRIQRLYHVKTKECIEIILIKREVMTESKKNKTCEEKFVPEGLNISGPMSFHPPWE